VIATTTPWSQVFSAALRGEPCAFVGASGETQRLPVEQWRQVADASDTAMLTHCVGATLDIGCGPGRMTQRLVELGHLALGIDVVPEAVAQTRQRGAEAIERDIFSPLPGEGRWQSVLLADGNIGIGGDPVALLARVRSLLAPGGRVVVDLDPPGRGIATEVVCLQTQADRSEAFAWSSVGADAIESLAWTVGLTLIGLHSYDRRWFAVLEKGVAW